MKFRKLRGRDSWFTAKKWKLSCDATVVPQFLRRQSLSQQSESQCRWQAKFQKSAKALRCRLRIPYGSSHYGTKKTKKRMVNKNVNAKKWPSKLVKTFLVWNFKPNRRNRAVVRSEISPIFTGPSGGTARAEAQATQEIERETPGRHQHKVDLGSCRCRRFFPMLDKKIHPPPMGKHPPGACSNPFILYNWSCKTWMNAICKWCPHNNIFRVHELVPVVPTTFNTCIPMLPRH